MVRVLVAGVIAAGLLGSSWSGSAVAQNAPAATTAATDKPAAEKTKRPMSAGQKAFIERERKCSAEWKEAKAAGKDKGTTWPKFLSACNKRLKAGS
jgi:hypothetical protein